ncbi:G2/mitotic-specific cyclin-B2 isoform X2 [Eurytemora carolleeae]|uniref:G2/mitotic-specific cyclin-B2 isoform X2 n=1 Tax=Eurytemora carolleeae TaxID=1294199 RepID=UPI000C75E92A|nr:G2/mitotic-specific cyclin-B2 isoform X2 [Eurytemora carolleeae]|eukprot:XP_023335403.1 G2/mitotic-specific cyclin-B2-like isoform X2 [Eurytemora affinis]
MSSVVNKSKIPIPQKLREDYTKPEFYRKTRHLSNVDSNSRFDIRTSRSSITGEDEIKQKPRKNSVVAEGKKTAGRKNSERCGGRTTINDDKENIAAIEDGKEIGRPLTAAEVIKEVIDEVFPDGQDEGLNGTEASEEETYKLPEGVVNIDIEDGLYEYAAEVIAYLKEREKVHVLPVNFLKGGSTHFSARAMLVDWLIQVQHHLQLCQETLYLTIIMLDTVLAQRDIKNDKLQLVGVTCLLLASKLEEYYPADISKLVHLTNDSYTNTQIVRMELIIIDVLEYKVNFKGLQT